MSWHCHSILQFDLPGYFLCYLTRPAHGLLNLFLINVIIISDLETLKNINKSARNIKNLKIINEAGANIYDMMKYKNVLLTQSSVKNLEKRILNEKN